MRFRKKVKTPNPLTEATQLRFALIRALKTLPLDEVMDISATTCAQWEVLRGSDG